MKWKAINSSELDPSEETVSGKCPATGEDAYVTLKFSLRQVSKTDLQKTPIYSGYDCSLYEKYNARFSECIGCPLIRKVKL